MAQLSIFWLLLRRDWIGAGDVSYRRGRLKKAANLYARGGQDALAARISMEDGDVDAAVGYYLQSGSPREAGEALASVGDHRAAIELLDDGGAHWQAAESALKVGRDAMAGKLYEKAKAFQQAADCYERAGESEAAIRVLESLLADPQPAETGAGPRDAKDQRQIELKLASLLESVANFGAAAAVVARLGEKERAAALYARAREYDRAVELYFEIGDLRRALELLPKSSSVDPEIQARIYESTGDDAAAARFFEDCELLEEAAACYERSEEWQRSAVVWERLGDADRAADLLVRVGLFEDAARCYTEAENFEAAARSWEQAGDPRKAAEVHLRAGNAVTAGRRFLEAGDNAAASRAFQRVEKSDPSFVTATFALVPLLLEQGVPKGALHRLDGVDDVGGAPEVATEKSYWLGRVYESLGEHQRAALQYQKVAASDLDFRDLRERLATLDTRQQRETQAIKLEGSSASESAVRPGSWVTVGDVINGRYRVVEELGRGGMSRVYSAVDQEFDEKVALKILLPRSDADGRDEERLLQEVRICRRISHPNVVRVFDFGRFGEGVFITMELLRGKTLLATVQDSGTLDFDQTHRLLGEILSGLGEAHRRRVIHRDLKPANVFLTADGAKVMDFGIARAEDSDPELTRTGHVVGSPMFMSPEQLEGQAVDARSDLYSLGVLTFFVLAGREPFTGTTATALALKHLGELPPTLASLRSETPPAWDDLVARLLAKDPSDRYPSAEAVREALESLPREGSS